MMQFTLVVCGNSIGTQGQWIRILVVFFNVEQLCLSSNCLVFVLWSDGDHNQSASPTKPQQACEHLWKEWERRRAKSTTILR